MYAVNDGAESAGINNGNSFSLSQVVHAYVDAYNGNGGVAGRKIAAVYAELHSASNSYEAQMQAACSTFTEDHHVAAIISNLGYYSPTLLSCARAAHLPIVTGDWSAPDVDDARRNPLLLTPTTLVGDERVAAVVAHLHAAGYLEPQNHIGVVIEDCPVNQRVYANGLVPALKQAGLSVATTFAPRCFQSLQDYGGQASDLQTGVLQFNRNGVDRVIVVSAAAEANVVNLFAQGADAQQYHPGYALSSAAAATILTLNAPAGQLANMRGVGWLPTLDTARQDQLAPSATGRHCLDLLKGRGLVPTSSADFAYAYTVCDSFEFYAALLSATAGDASASAISGAVGQAAGAYVSASTVSGGIRIADGRVGASTGRLFAYVGSGFAYTSDPFPLTP